MSGTGLYRGQLSHRRESPLHQFERDVLLARVDIDKLDAAPKGVLRLIRRWPIFIRSHDHLPDSKSPNRPLAERVRRLVESAEIASERESTRGH